MDIQNALIMFDALSQETRLRAFRLLVKAGPEGLPAGQIGQHLDIPHNTLSFHLTHLAHADMVTSTKQGRSIIYAANFDAMRGLLQFLIQDCCSASFASVREDSERGCSVIELANDIQATCS